MASHGWRSGHSVASWLFDEPYRFDFYQAVRLLERLHPDRHGVGEAFDPEREVVRFRSHVGLSFPPSDIRSVEPPAAGAPPTMVVNFLGLAGVTAPLPYAYTELVLQRIKEKDTALLDFLNMFNHRLVSLMYRVRKLHRVGFDPVPAERSLHAKMLFSLAGFAGPAARRQFAAAAGVVEETAAERASRAASQSFAAIVDRTLLQYVGIFSRTTRTLMGLESLVAAHFHVPVKGKALRGGWLQIDPDDVTRIGRGGANNALGVAMLGSRVWDQMAGVELEIGPLDDRQYLDLLPGAPGNRELAALTGLYVGGEIDVDVTLAVRVGPALSARLGRTGGSRLGWTSWLSSKPGSVAVHRKKLSKPPASSQAVTNP